MPIQRCHLEGKPGLKYGNKGHCYIYTPGNKRSKKLARAKAIAQSVAIRDSSYVEKEYIEKARKRAPNEARVLLKIADKLQPLLQAGLLSGIISFRERIDLNDIEQLIRQGRYGDIEASIPWEALPGDIAAIERIAARGITEGAKSTQTFYRRAISRILPSIAANEFTFNPSNPAVARAILVNSGRMIGQIDETSRQAIRQIVFNSQLAGLPPRESAKLIKEVIGLTPKQAQAVANFKINLEAGNLSKLTSLARTTIAPQIGKRNLADPVNRAKFDAAIARSSIDKLADAYADRLLKQRAENIARTETWNNVNTGVETVWNQAFDDGLVDRAKTGKQWFTARDERTCLRCAPMDGQIVPVDQEFVSPYDGSSTMMPGLHNHCRCFVSLVLTGSQT